MTQGWSDGPMTVFVAQFSYLDRPADLDRVRPERLTWFRRITEEGRLLASGQLPDAEVMSGLLIMTAQDVREAEAILDDDPYARAGLMRTRSVQAWNPTVGTHVGRS